MDEESIKESENLLREKLKKYSQLDIYFLKKEWREAIRRKNYDLIQKQKGINIQIIYDLLNPSKIKSIRKAKYGSKRHSIILEHSKFFEIEVIVKFETPRKGLLGIVTIIKKKIKQQDIR